MSRICYIGKYPPLQGGTATQGMWLVHALAAAGHEVDVVSLGAYGGPAFNCAIGTSDWADLEHRYPVFSRVRRHELHQEPAEQSFAIPTTDPLVTRLVSTSLAVFAKVDYEFIIGHYMEPFGVAAAYVSSLVGRPYAVIHAGSDITRLSDLPTRHHLYRRVVVEADLVLSTVTAGRLAVRLGADPLRVVTGRPALTPPDLFSPATPASDLGAIVAPFAHSQSEYEAIGHLPAPDTPIVVVPGKIGSRKGTFVLVRALGLLKSNGLARPHLVFVTEQGSERFARLRQEIATQFVDDEVTLLPFLPQWRLAGLYRASSAVAFLENRFPVAVHRPQVPREAASAGSCLILSREVAEYQRSVRPIVHGKDALLVDDPARVDQVAQALARVAADPALCQTLGKASENLYRWPSDAAMGGWIDRFVALLMSAYDERKCRLMALQDFQNTVIRIYADRKFRELLVAHPKELDAQPLTAIEIDTVRKLLADRSTLDRYCASLLNKKYAFLSRHFTDVFSVVPDLEARLREAFLERWVLEEGALASEISRFETMLLDVLSGLALADREQIRSTAQLAAARARVLFVDVDHAAAPDLSSEAALVRLAPSCELLDLVSRPTQSGGTVREQWCGVVFPDPVEFTARTIEVSSEMLGLLRRLSESQPVGLVIAELRSRSNGQPDERIASVLRRFVELGVLVSA